MTSGQVQHLAVEQVGLWIVLEAPLITFVAQYIHGVTPASLRSRRTDRTEPLSVTGCGWGRWNTAYLPFNSTRIREPRPSVTSAPQARNRLSMSPQAMDGLIGSLKTASSVRRCLLFMGCMVLLRGVQVKAKLSRTPMPEHKKPYGLGQAKPARSRAALWCYLVFVTILALASMSFATQRVAAYYGFHPALGAPLGHALDLAWYAPWSIFAWQSMPGLADPQGYVEQSLSFAQALFILPQFLVLSLFVGRPQAQQGLRGPARLGALGTAGRNPRHGPARRARRVRGRLAPAASRGRALAASAARPAGCACSVIYAITARSTYSVSRPRARAKAWG